jgi:sulfite oxidase
VYDILEQYLIGKIDPRDLNDGKLPSEAVEDPFSTDPARDESLIERSARPCNAETPASRLGAFITPNEVFYVRNHLWVPDIADPAAHNLKIELIDGEEVEYTLNDLRRKFKPCTITATLQCSGNRRAHMTRGSRQTNGLQWEMGAISTAEWTGVRLRDVLADAGVNVDDLPDTVKHAQFMGAEAYGASIPIEKAVDRRGDTILAYEMNGEPLPRDHGFPLRVVVPGHVAARSVKWLNKIVLSDEESTSQWQRRDYKCFGVSANAEISVLLQ